MLRSKSQSWRGADSANLLERDSARLVAHIDALREAVRTVCARHPFHIDAWVVLPDHMHAVWTLPADDADYPGRWKAGERRG